MKKAFTLAEVMITLTVIGIITAVIIPVAIQSKPNENILKFKKAHNTLYQTIQILINSDKYYLDGDLGIRADGVQLAGKYDEYFCSTVADVLSAKKISCPEDLNTHNYGQVNLYSGAHDNDLFACEARKNSKYEYIVTSETIAKAKSDLDDICKKVVTTSYVVAIDNISFFETNPGMKFGSAGDVPKYCSQYTASGAFPRYFSPPNQFPAIYHDQNGMDINYKVYCIDIDSIPTKDGSKCDDIKDICPFGYGIRADGKILTGKRADEWLLKSISD